MLASNVKRRSDLGYVTGSLQNVCRSWEEYADSGLPIFMYEKFLTDRSHRAALGDLAGLDGSDDSSLEKVSKSWRVGSSFDGMNLPEMEALETRYLLMKDHPTMIKFSRMFRRLVRRSDEMFGTDHEKKMVEAGIL